MAPPTTTPSKKMKNLKVDTSKSNLQSYPESNPPIVSIIPKKLKKNKNQRSKPKNPSLNPAFLVTLSRKFFPPPLLMIMD